MAGFGASGKTHAAAAAGARAKAAKVRSRVAGASPARGSRALRAAVAITECPRACATHLGPQ
ncbi:Hypothetical predicted protein, partial [Marmota monax]